MQSTALGFSVRLAPWTFALLAAGLLQAHFTAHAQQQKPPSGGVISGHVSFADNDKPARFATVYLKAVTPSAASDDFFTVLMDSSIVNMQQKRLNGSAPSSEDVADLKSARAAATGFMHHVSEALLSATISADGEYSFSNVPPGSYYLHTDAPGYIDTLTEFTDDELESNDPAMRKKVAAAVSIVSIAGSEQVRENLRPERGAVISGRVMYDDGSAATGWTVRALAKGQTSQTDSQNILGIDLSQLPTARHGARAVTDDTGRFRIAGLPGGDFVLEATLVTAALDRQPFAPVASSEGSFLSILGGLADMHGLRLAVYSGGAIRLHDAQSITLRPGEERLGTDMVARLVATHSIAGFVVSQTDGHAVNSGDVELIAEDKDGHDDASSRLSASVQPDGSFRFDYVPSPATYTLRAVHAGDMSAASTMKLLGSMIAERKSLRGYAPASTVITLDEEDMRGIKVAVTDLGAAAKSGH